MNTAELLFAKTHEWVSISEQDGAKIATLGVSAFAVEQLTDLVFIDLPDVGSFATAGEPIGEIESVKAVSDLYSPVSGEVIEVNQSLADSPESLNRDPYEQGWIAKIRMGDDAPPADLMDYAAYQKQCENDG